jgi:glucose-1-phosphate adenylyltransferase
MKNRQTLNNTCSPEKCLYQRDLCVSIVIFTQAFTGTLKEVIHSMILEKNILPRLIEKNRVIAYPFEDKNKRRSILERCRNNRQLWESNMDLIEYPLFNLYDNEWPVRTIISSRPPAKFVFADFGHRLGVALDSIVSPGSIISGGMVKRSVLSTDVRVNSYAYVEESILFDECNIGRHSRIRRAIVEKNVQIPDNTVIGYDLEEDAKKYRVTSSGIVVVEKKQ